MPESPSIILTDGLGVEHSFNGRPSRLVSLVPSLTETLARLGDVLYIDADRLSRHVMAPGTDVWRQIVDTFGAEIAAPDGSLDRGRLGEIVFGDAAALARLEAIVHPAVIALTEQRIAKASTQGSPVVVVEAIKLIESGMVRRLCDVVWVVTAPREVRRTTSSPSRPGRRSARGAPHASRRRRPRAAAARPCTARRVGGRSPDRAPPRRSPRPRR